MNELELNIENLYSIGLTPEIIKTDFENWVINNKDIIVDFENKKIYTNLEGHKKDLANTLEIIKNDWINNGGSIEDFEQKIESIRKNLKVNFDDIFNNIPDIQDKIDFNNRFVIKSSKKFKEKKLEYFEKKLDEILNSPTKDLSKPLNFNNDLDDSVQIDNKNNDIEPNPYPRIFTSPKAFEIFKNLLEAFGNTKEKLANYSFVYHRMKKDELIYDDFQKLQFTYFLLNFNIKIDRIKRIEDIGKIELREGIYTKAK